MQRLAVSVMLWLCCGSRVAGEELRDVPDDPLLASPASSIGSPRQRPAGDHPVETVTDYRWREAGSSGEGVIVLASDGRLLEYRLPVPRGPVAAGELTAASAAATAHQFVARRIPALAEDGDVSLTNLGLREGGWRFRSQRRKNGVGLPILAEIGIRVPDGKVMYWQLKDEPVEVEVQRTITVEAARSAVSEALAANQHKPLVWLQEDPQVKATEAGWRVVYDLVAEVGPPDAAALGSFRQWWVDANNRAILKSEQLPLTPELYRQYRAAGGVRMPERLNEIQPRPLFQDGLPQVSPDGRTIAFHSARPRPAYPEWVDRPAGVFVAGIDGQSLRCLVADAAANPVWAPDGQRLSYSYGCTLGIVDLDGKLGPQWETKKGLWRGNTWLSDGRIVALDGGPEGATELQFLDPAKPELSEVLRWKRPPGGWFTAVLTDAEGRLLFTIRQDPGYMQPPDMRRRKEPYSLWRLDPAVVDGTPERVTEYLTAGFPAGVLPDGRLAFTARSANKAVAVDAATGEFEELARPRAKLPPEVTTAPDTPEQVSFSRDGQFWFIHTYWSGDPEAPAGDILWRGGLIGPEGLEQAEPATPIALPSNEPVPLVQGEPVQ